MITIEIYFSIRSDEFNPKYITDYLGIEPSSFCIKGTEKRKGQTPYKENVWTLKAPCSEKEKMDEQIKTLINILQPAKTKLISIWGKCSFDVDAVIHLDSEPATPEIIFNINAVKFFSEIGAELGVEVFCL